MCVPPQSLKLNKIRFQKTDQSVTLGLFHFTGPATLIHYPFTMALPGLADWSALLGKVLLIMYSYD